MAIDGIGKRGAPPAPPVGTEQAGKTGAANATSTANVSGTKFEVPETQAGKATQAAQDVQAAEPSALARVRSGDMTVHQYLDIKVDEATAHLGQLAPSQRTMIKDALRSQMATDPALADLVQQATGHLPEPSES